MVDHDRNIVLRWFIALIIFIISMFTTAFTINYVNTLSKQEITHDLILNIVPFNVYYAIIGESLMVLILIIFIAYIIRNRYSYRIPYYITAIGIFYLLKSLILPLTPLTSPYPLDANTYGILFNIIPPGGTFPSGHTGFVFIIYFLVYSEVLNNKKKDSINTLVKNTILILSVIVAVFMITSRGHYTIDVIGGLLLSYVTYRMMQNYKIKEYFLYR